MRLMIFLIISVIIFITFAVWTQNMLESSAGNLGRHLDHLEAAIKNDNWPSADNQVKAITRLWNENKKSWQIFINHEEVDNIDSSLASVKQLVEIREKAVALAEIAVLKLFILHIPEKESLSLVNVF